MLTVVEEQVGREGSIEQEALLMLLQGGQTQPEVAMSDLRSSQGHPEEGGCHRLDLSDLLGQQLLSLVDEAVQ